MSKPSVLVTGADGFVGSHLVEYLQSAGYTDIFATTYAESEWLSAHLPADHIFAGDLTDSDHVFAMVQKIKPDWVIHLASLSFVGDSFSKTQFVMDTNTHIQYVMLEAVRQHAPGARFLSIGSATCYGPAAVDLDPEHISEDYPFAPNNPYAVSKLTQEHLAQMYHLTYDLDVVRVRPFNQIGPRQAEDFVVPAFAKQIAAIEAGQQDALRVGNLEAVRDFTDVRDAVRAYERLMLEGVRGEVYNLGSGQGVKIQTILDTLRKLSEADILVQPDESRMRPADIPIFVADARKLHALGWQPSIPLEETLRDVLAFERQKMEKEA
ncbi:GDP-mannose 4,6-dehydratase [Candidatus Woesebacteria bacterium]|nr:GDP-mannose 4,6-dehydratase [Candidatus Woesebacteria bacterium]MCD8507518.1 GDP-mannose 4,6-dehydratase [Candidatus Woesebacteria bacterium]MCD8527357.1 GDP-mannose 4,6-dehydratase [Candidatus Woesebacteria bacterium]MCD8546104.1 GDP-mannose 4,6-dehydratase [Candidatus Woesebacteria bacterium]